MGGCTKHVEVFFEEGVLLQRDGSHIGALASPGFATVFNTLGLVLGGLCQGRKRAAKGAACARNGRPWRSLCGGAGRKAPVPTLSAASHTCCAVDGARWTVDGARGTGHGAWGTVHGAAVKSSRWGVARWLARWQRARNRTA